MQLLQTDYEILKALLLTATKLSVIGDASSFESDVISYETLSKYGYIPLLTEFSCIFHGQYLIYVSQNT